MIDHEALYEDHGAAFDESAYLNLRPVEKVFVEAYLANLAASAKAAMVTLWDQFNNRPPPSDLGARGAAMLSNPKVKRALAYRVRLLTEKYEVDQNRLMRETAAIAFSNMSDYLYLTEEGEPYISLAGCSHMQMAAISEITVEDYKEGRGEDARDVRRVKLKLHDKLNAIEKLLKLTNMYAPEKVEVTHKIDNGPTADMTDEQLADKWAETLKVIDG